MITDDNGTITACCAWCPWKTTGNIRLDVRDALKAHRQDAHAIEGGYSPTGVA